MSGTPHPAAVVYPTGSNIAKSDIIADDKLKERRLPDANAIRNGDWSGQFGLLFVAALDAFFKIDTTDTSTADDGLSCIIDANGLRFKKVIISTADTQLKITAAGDVTLANDCQDIIVIAKTVGAATQVALPDASARIKPVRIVDGKYDALTNNITIVPKAASGQLIMGGASYVIDSNGGSIKLVPLADGTGWI